MSKTDHEKIEDVPETETKVTMSALPPADSVTFALYLYKRAKEAYPTLEIGDTKLQKLVYLCYGIYAGFTKRKLIEQAPQAWPYGPVFDKLYEVQKLQRTQHNGMNALVASYESLCMFENFRGYDEIIDPVLELFGGRSASWLVDYTHKPKQAWDKVKDRGWRTELAFSDIVADYDWNK